MPQIAPFPGTGIDRRTGQVISGWAHVLQSLEVIFTTRYGERAGRRHLGSFVPAILGKNLVESTIINFWTAICVAIERPAEDMGEPRYKITQIVPYGSPEEMRGGRVRFQLNGVYYPRGHLGDFTAAGPRAAIVILGGSGFSVGSA
jgi:phage baseplate assembly protein W